MNNLIYLDTETSGLNPDTDIVWEIAWAVNDGPMNNGFVSHSIGTLRKHSNSYGMTIGGFHERYSPETNKVNLLQLRRDLTDSTLVGANPAFDAAFLRKLLGATPWHYRLFDVESYLMIPLGVDRPVSLNNIYLFFKNRGFDITAPDHTAAADVQTVRDALKYVKEL